MCLSVAEIESLVDNPCKENSNWVISATWKDKLVPTLFKILLEIIITARRFFILGLLLNYSSILKKIYPQKPLRKLLGKTSMVEFSFTLVASCQSQTQNALQQSVFLAIFQTLTKIAIQSTYRKRDKLLCSVSKNFESHKELLYESSKHRLSKQNAHNEWNNAAQKNFQKCYGRKEKMC